MPKFVKIMLIGAVDQQLQLIQNFCAYQDQAWGPAFAQPGMAARNLTVKGDELQIQIYATPSQNDDTYEKVAGNLVQDAHIVLAVSQPKPDECGDLKAYADSMKQWFKGLLNWLFPEDAIQLANGSGAILPIFLIYAQRKHVPNLRSQFPVQTDELKVEANVINASVCEASPEFVCKVLARKITKAVQEKRIIPAQGALINSPPATKPIAADQASIFEILGQLSGMLVAAALGMLAASVVYNPLASLFAAASGLMKNKSFKDFALLLVSPIWGPLFGLFYQGMYLQGLRGWEDGFKQSFNALFEVPKNAALKEKTPISSRNIFASLVIIALSLAAVASVLISPISLLLGFPSLVIALGLSGISIPWLAVLAGGVTLVASTALYALGVVLTDYAFDCGLAGIKRSLSVNGSGTYQRLTEQVQPLAPSASPHTPTAEGDRREDAIGAKSVSPVIASRTAEPATTVPLESDLAAGTGLPASSLSESIASTVQPAPY